MNAAPHPGWRDWLAGVVLGTSLGALVLGVGGRVAMRGIAVLAGQAPGFSWGGTATIVFLGAVWGCVGAVVLVGLHRLVRGRRLLRASLFWAFLLLLTLRGLDPVDPLRVAVFVPLVALYGVALQLLWCRSHRRQSSARSALGPGVAA